MEMHHGPGEVSVLISSYLEGAIVASQQYSAFLLLSQFSRRTRAEMRNGGGGVGCEGKL